MPRTLVIDDDPNLQALISEGASGDFFFAHSDREALEILSAKSAIDIALVIVDSEHISGMGLFRRLSGQGLRIPRIALSASEDIQVIRRAMHEGAVDFLTKPLSIHELQATINKVFIECERRRKAWRTESELAALRREIDIAGELQKRILPNDFPVRADLEIFARTTPAKDIGGDFYDFFELESGALALIVADVSGKGVPAAFFMAVARTLIRATAVNQSDPGPCLEQVNRLLYQHNIPGMFVSVFYAIVDTCNWRMHYANGGHLPPCLIPGDGGAIRILDGADGVVLGIQDEIPYQQGTVCIDPGTSVFIYTDGVTEAFDSERQQFSHQRLRQYLQDNRSASAQAMTEDLFDAINHFISDAPQSDDITGLVIKRLSNE